MVSRQMLIAGMITVIMVFAGTLTLFSASLYDDSNESSVARPGHEYGVSESNDLLPEYQEDLAYETTDYYSSSAEMNYEETEFDDPEQQLEFINEFTEIPEVKDTESEFEYAEETPDSTDLESESVSLEDFETQLALQSRGKPEDDGEKGNKLGNAPTALYNVLQKFITKGKKVPPNFPVPYKIYTNSSGVEKFTDCLTKMPIMINVDNDKDTGQGNGKDISVKTTISTNPLEMTLFVERKSGTPAPDLQIYVSFPAFFYNGEAGDPDGEPYWLFGYETLAGSDIPEDITITFSVNQSLGSNHIFDFDCVFIKIKLLV